MSKQTKDQEVLLAILNVKKYAKNLRKKASNLQDPNNEPDLDLAGSSPSFFDHTHQLHDYLEPNSPLLATKSSYNESFQTMAHKKKQHSMAYLPYTRKADRQMRKNSDCLVPQPLSPAKTYTHALGRTNLSQSYKIEGSGMKSKQSVWKKQVKQPSAKFISLERKGLGNKDSELNSGTSFQQFNQTMPVISNGQASRNSGSEQKIFNAKVVQELLEEVCRLKNQICEYKSSLVLFRSKYLEMVEKCREKAEIDHLLDKYRERITDLEHERELLQQTVKSQNHKIASFQSVIIQIAKKFSVHYIEQSHKTKVVTIQNDILKEILNLKTPSVHVGSNTTHLHHGKIKRDGELQSKAKYEDAASSEIQSEDSEPMPVWVGSSSPVCKNERDIKTKYDVFRNFIE